VCDAEDNCPAVCNPGQVDADSDGFGDACDGPFDADHDGDVDGADYLSFSSCLDGPGTVVTIPCREVHDGDEDDDVDLLDWAAFQLFFGTSQAPAGQCL
jgi:hypothetical protein